jgi:3-phosphoshikimate 1-carboxyvinyltransferase
MRIRVSSGQGGGEGGDGPVSVPGDKSIAHRWLIFAATARGTSSLAHLPPSLDVRSTASCLSRVTLKARPALDLWASNASSWVEGGGSTWNETSREGSREGSTGTLQVEGEGRDALVESRGDLDCGNSGTSMRLLTGLLSSVASPSRLVGDASLSSRPMERVAAPLRRMGARIETTEGHAPVVVAGGSLHGVEHRLDVPTAQVKGALLLAGVAADGVTVVTEPVGTRDHTERALAALGAPVRREGTTVGVTRFQHDGFDGSVPGDVSSAAFLIGAAALSRRALSIEGVGLNPTRTRYLDVLSRMGVRTETVVTDEQLGEPVGRIDVLAGAELRGTTIDEEELPAVIDEVALLAVVAAHASGETWFLGARELRVKETDRLTLLAAGIRSLGGHAAAEADDLVVAGGGLRGGVASSGGDHRLAMAFAVAGVAAEGACEVGGVEAAEVSFPGFVEALRAAGASVEVVG